MSIRFGSEFWVEEGRTTGGPPKRVMAGRLNVCSPVFTEVRHSIECLGNILSRMHSRSRVLLQ